MKNRLVLTAGVVAGVVCARGDVVLLQDGRRFEGVILKDDQHEVTIDTMVSSIRSKLTFRRIDVRTMEKGPVPDGFFGAEPKRITGKPESSPEGTPLAKAPESAPSGKKPAETKPAKDTYAAGAYLDVPLIGTFGEDIYPKGVEAALTAAEERGIKHVVFHIKSPGGEVWAARKIAEILAEHEGKVTTHALIEEALSASIWVVFSCDTVEIAPGGTVGAAVVFKREHTTGAAEVDAKMNSALAAELGAVAERHGRDPAIVRAMMLPEAELYAWEEGGKPNLASQRPPAAPAGMRVLSDRSDVLTLTAEEAARIGLAERVAGADAIGVGLARGIEGWTLVEKLGEETMRKQSKVSADARAELEHLAEKLKAAIVEAVSSDPSHYKFEINTRTGEMNPDSKRRWTELSDKAIAAWTHAKAALGAFERMRGKAAELGLEGFISTKLDSKELKYTLAEIDQRVAALRKDRYRSNLPAEFQK